MVFADANIVLELLLPDRIRKHAVAKALRGEQAAISMLSVHLAHYFGRKEKYTAEQIHDSLSEFQLLDVTADDYVQALELLADNEFEDALQLAVALRSGCSKILTIDQTFAQNYSTRIDFEVPKNA